MPLSKTPGANTIMRKVLSTMFALALLSCSNDPDEGVGCFHGPILDYDCCAGVTLISLNASLPNSKTVQIGDVTYPNVIIVPGHLDSPNGTELFLRVRKYDAEKDSHLLDGLCLCVSINRPTYVITSSSTSGCQ